MRAPPRQKRKGDADISVTINYTQLYANLAGWRLIVLANRAGCMAGLALELHDTLLEGLSGKMATALYLSRLEREIPHETDAEERFLAKFLYEGAVQSYFDERIVLLDDLEIDYDTYEYRVNGGEWSCAYSADCDGVSVEYPTTAGLTDEELGGLGPIVRGISSETGVAISAVRVDYD